MGRYDYASPSNSFFEHSAVGKRTFSYPPPGHRQLAAIDLIDCVEARQQQNPFPVPRSLKASSNSSSSSEVCTILTFLGG
jgi:hypothetical protein